MGNMISYAEKYRTTSFAELPFCAVDSLILSQLVYYNYEESPFTGQRFDCTLKQFSREIRKSFWWG